MITNPTSFIKNQGQLLVFFMMLLSGTSLNIVKAGASNLYSYKEVDVCVVEHRNSPEESFTKSGIRDFDRISQFVRDSFRKVKEPMIVKTFRAYKGNHFYPYESCYASKKDRESTYQITVTLNSTLTKKKKKNRVKNYFSNVGVNISVYYDNNLISEQETFAWNFKRKKESKGQDVLTRKLKKHVSKNIKRIKNDLKSY